MKRIIIISLLISTICDLAVVSNSQYVPKAILYSSLGGSGSFLELLTNQQYLSLEPFGFDDKARSVCLTGTWLFYDLVNHNEEEDAGMEYIFEPTYQCQNFKQLGNHLSSAKYVGSSTDFRTDSITFYEKIYFQQEEEYVISDLEHLRLNGRIASLIITGSSDWTIYDEPRFSGKAICLKIDGSPEYAPAFVVDTFKLNPTVPHGSIASVRKGCYTNKMLSIPVVSAKPTINYDSEED